MCGLSLNILLYFSRKIGLVNLLFACLFLGHGSLKFKYSVSIFLSNTSSILLASKSNNFKLFNSKFSNFFTPLTKTLAYFSTPIKLISGYLEADSIIKSHFPVPISKHILLLFSKLIS